MARPRHQSGWITEHGNKIYGHFWRYVIDPVTKRRKRTHASVPLGYIGKLKKWEAKEKLKSLIAEDLGPQQATERLDPKTTFGWFVKHRYLPMREGRWHKATKDKTGYEINLNSEAPCFVARKNLRQQEDETKGSGQSSPA